MTLDYTLTSNTNNIINNNNNSYIEDGVILDIDNWYTHKVMSAFKVLLL